MTDKEFWVRGHMPDFALMPGVVLCECAAQLGGFYARKYKVLGGGDFLGFGGMEEVRFRSPVFPGDRLSYDAALFDTRVSNKLSKQAVFDTDGTVLYSYTVNAGDQKNLGFEASAGYAIVSNPASLLSFLRPFVTYTWNDFTYSDFKSDNNNDASTVDYSGLQVVGTVKNVVNLGVDARLRPGLYGNATYHHTEGMPISYDNAHWAPGFSLLNAKVGFARTLLQRWTVDAFVGGDNLTSSRYYTLVFLNHKWDSPTPPNMYLPGPYKAKYYMGMKVSVRP